MLDKAKQLYERVVDGGRRGGESTSEAKVKAAQANIAKARATREMYRKFPILRKVK